MKKPRGKIASIVPLRAKAPGPSPRGCLTQLHKSCAILAAGVGPDPALAARAQQLLSSIEAGEAYGALKRRAAEYQEAKARLRAAPVFRDWVVKADRFRQFVWTSETTKAPPRTGRGASLSPSDQN